MQYYKVTGSNDVPLGKDRTFGKGLSGMETENPIMNNDGESTLPEGRRTRWGDVNVKVNIPGLPTNLPSRLTKDEIDSYIINLRIEEISQKLRSGNVVPPERNRSPSPEPIYGADGKRINTREYRYRKKLEDERHKLIEEGQKRFKDFKPPADYKKSNKHVEKVWIPSLEFTEINFIGQLLGPRGNTLKKMETESGAKISIRGKGSIKEGKARQDGVLAPGEEEDLHCLVTADSEEKIAKAVKLINKIIETAASVPEEHNELKRQQLRALAALNGTLREDDAQICSNCGATGHRKSECPDQKNFTINLICRICGGAGHTASDCMQRNNQDMIAAAQQREQQFNNEYMNLMVELGETNTNANSSSTNNNNNNNNTNSGSTGHYGPTSMNNGSSIPPWQSNNTKTESSTSPPWAKQVDNNTYQAPANPWSVPPPPGMANFQNNSLPGIPGIPTAPPPTSNTMPAPPGQVQGYNPYGYNPYGGYDNPQQNWKPPMNEYAPPPPSEHPPPPPTQ
jgi:splicing factor 1